MRLPVVRGMWTFKTLVTYKLGEVVCEATKPRGRILRATVRAPESGVYGRQRRRAIRGASGADIEHEELRRDTDAYAALSKGKLPQAQLHAMARRIAAKMFLAHFHHVLYETHYGHAPEKPWIIEHGGHVDWHEAPPNWPLVE